MARVKRIKLELDEEIEFPILGISTALPDYRLVWKLNKNMDLSFQKENNFFTLPNKRKSLNRMNIIYTKMKMICPSFFW